MVSSPPEDDSLERLCNSPIATVVTDPRIADNPIVAVNEAFERLTGYAASEVIGRNCRFLSAPNAAQPGSEILREAVRSRQPALVELDNYKRNGTRFRNAVMIAPVFDADGTLKYFVGSQMEVADGAPLESTRKRAAEALVAKLTPRQRQVLHEMVLGYRNKQIAARLGLSEKTVKMHRGRMLERLGAASSSYAVRIGVEAGL